MEPNLSGTDPADEPVERTSLFASARRLDAQRQRDQAWELYRKSKAVWEEAARSGEAARSVCQDDPAPGAGSISQRIHAIKEQSEACEASYRRLWDRALAARDRSAEEFRRAADAAAAANAQVEQELADAADVLVAAECAFTTAMDELQRSQAFWTELDPSLDGELAPGHQSSMVTTHESPNVLCRELTQCPAEVDATGGAVTTGPDQADVAKSGLGALDQEEPADTEAVSATATLRKEIARARKPGSSSNLPSPAEEVLHELETLKGLQRELLAISPIVMNPIATDPIATDPIGTDPIGTDPMVTDPIGTDPIGTDPIGTDPIVTNKETIQKKGQAAEPTFEPAVADIGLENMAPSDEPALVSTTETAPVPPDAAAIYTGRVYLMFDANLTQDVLEAVWDAIEESSEVGAIVDTRLVSQEEGVQMTLDLRESQLDISAVRARLPGAELAPMGEDRLRVSWPVPV